MDWIDCYLRGKLPRIVSGKVPDFASLVDFGLDDVRHIAPELRGAGQAVEVVLPCSVEVIGDSEESGNVADNLLCDETSLDGWATGRKLPLPRAGSP